MNGLSNHKQAYEILRALSRYKNDLIHISTLNEVLNYLSIFGNLF